MGGVNIILYINKKRPFSLRKAFDIHSPIPKMEII